MDTYSFYPLPQELAMPALSPTMSQGNLVEWTVKEGQEVAPGDSLAEVETDKATMTWENQDDGFVAKILVPAGAQGIEVGTPVLVLVEDEADVAAFKDYQPQGQAAGGNKKEEGSESKAPAAKPEKAQPASGAARNDHLLGPAARLLLQGAGLSVEDVTPTGPHGVVTKGDEAAASAAPSGGRARRQRGQFTDVPNSQIRKIIASRLSESKSTIPHLYLSADVDLTALAALRAALKAQGLKISVNDCVVKAAAGALAAVPAANFHWDDAEERAVRSEGVDISIAVATDKGLITPVVRGADGKALTAVASEIRELAGRARKNKLRPEEFQGGSFSISNLGMFGIDSFCAIINPPQACIMAVGAGREETVLVDGRPQTKTIMTVTLSADHRVYDGEIASALLESFKAKIEAPYTLLLA
ncbi:hypothetical protein QBZ16_003503 [Prototheca wickerhamii]|uniref:Dihydrolipoamide acetyltransferase component of pyruvate dehydrogenase complex n=1 Tax=Prototheca wickerhamii TaxID=3111 RepID=A0AAD9MLT7_PROWI|nr:hypothetical protein QBZ16_003503 [Prototheca wickerhamii]